ncbi:peptide-methionine (S)-S-oxide reductase MsrA [Candidatus Saccharibacteria bacterium]|nr:MAG: peptide-methionine (S)-S-oxide reductase MsrA [Candidatus Saccharibacteria bacterium]
MIKSIVFGGGCFWCSEAVFQRVDGVTKVVPGYAGGTVPDPMYEQVCSGKTGHAEVVKVDYDDTKISLEHLLHIFFRAHDPTTLNRQGADEGSQYRSVILYGDKVDAVKAQSVIEEIQAETATTIVTEVAKLDAFYEAEAYHRNYFEQHPEQAYCQIVINPKIDKLREYLRDNPI